MAVIVGTLMVRLSLIILLCFVPCVCLGDVISDLRPAIWKAAITYHQDPIFMEAILRHESANGTSRGARVKNNLAGIMRKRGGLRQFDSKEECVDNLGEILLKYEQRGKKSITAIARSYAGRRYSSQWVRHVSHYMNRIKAGQWGVLDEKALIHGN